MTENQFHLLMNLAEKLKREATKESAVKTLVGAGILNEKLEFTAPYKSLGKVVENSKKKSV